MSHPCLPRFFLRHSKRRRRQHVGHLVHLVHLRGTPNIDVLIHNVGPDGDRFIGVNRFVNLDGYEPGLRDDGLAQLRRR